MISGKGISPLALLVKMIGPFELETLSYSVCSFNYMFILFSLRVGEIASVGRLWKRNFSSAFAMAFFGLSRDSRSTYSPCSFLTVGIVTATRRTLPQLESVIVVAVVVFFFFSLVLI